MIGRQGFGATQVAFCGLCVKFVNRKIAVLGEVFDVEGIEFKQSIEQRSGFIPMPDASQSGSQHCLGFRVIRSACEHEA